MGGAAGANRRGGAGRAARRWRGGRARAGFRRRPAGPLRAGRAQHRLRRPLHVRPASLRAGAALRRPADSRGRTTIRSANSTSCGSWTSSPICTRTCRRPTSSALDTEEIFKYPVVVHGRTGLLGSQRRGSRPVPRLSAEGRVRHLRRLRGAARLSGTRRRLGLVRIRLQAGPADGAVRRTSRRRIRSFIPSSRSTPLISFRRPTTKGGRRSAACSRTTTRRSGWSR